jgi:hypothetical protein
MAKYCVDFEPRPLSTAEREDSLKRSESRKGRNTVTSVDTDSLAQIFGDSPYNAPERVFEGGHTHYLPIPRIKYAHWSHPILE